MRISSKCVPGGARLGGGSSVGSVSAGSELSASVGGSALSDGGGDDSEGMEEEGVLGPEVSGEDGGCDSGLVVPDSVAEVPSVAEVGTVLEGMLSVVSSLSWAEEGADGVDGDEVAGGCGVAPGGWLDEASELVESGTPALGSPAVAGAQVSAGPEHTPEFEGAGTSLPPAVTGLLGDPEGGASVDRAAPSLLAPSRAGSTTEESRASGDVLQPAVRRMHPTSEAAPSTGIRRSRPKDGPLAVLFLRRLARAMRPAPGTVDGIHGLNANRYTVVRAG